MLGLGSNYIPMSAEPGLKPQPPVPTGIQDIDLQNQQAYQEALAYWNQQNALSSTAVTGTLTSTIPGGAQGITVAGVPGGLATTGSTTQIGSVLDQMASNLSGFATSVGNVFGINSSGSSTSSAFLQSFASVLGVDANGNPTGTGFLQTLASIFGVSIGGSKGVGGVSPSTLSAAPGMLKVSTGSNLVSTAMAQQSQALGDHLTATNARLTVETQITALSQQRVQSETQLVGLKMQEINADMARIAAHNNMILSTGKSASTLEDSMQAVYNSRARQGIGGFYGETANPL
jgi:hypothetical protein